eukprot:6487824-Amphidinium_carterae.2
MSFISGVNGPALPDASRGSIASSQEQSSLLHVSCPHSLETEKHVELLLAERESSVASAPILCAAVSRKIEMQLASLRDRLRLWHGVWVINDITGECVPIYHIGVADGLFYADTGQAYLSFSSGCKWLSALSLHHIYTQEAAMRAYSKLPGDAGWKQENISLEHPVMLCAFPVCLSHGLLSVNIRIRTSGLPVAGTQTWVYLAALHKQLGLQCCHSAMTWVGKAAQGWRKWLLEHMHVHTQEFLHGTGACGSRNLLLHDVAQHVSVNALLLLCSRWLSSCRAGLRSVEDKDKIVHFLEVLLSHCLPSGEMPLVISLVPPTECKGEFPPQWPNVSRISLSRRGVLVFTLPNAVLEVIPIHCMSPDEDRIKLSVVLRVCYENKFTQGVLQQICLQLGRFIDRVLWIMSWGSETIQATHRLEAMRYNAQYLEAGRRTFASASGFSLAVDASRVGKRKVLMGVIAASDVGFASIVPPQEMRVINPVNAQIS